MTRPDLDAIRARCDAASGPTWTWEINDATTPVRSDVSRIVSMDAMRDRQQSGIKTSARLPYLATVYNRADTEFIAHARTDIPALLAHIEELEGRVTYTVGETEWAMRVANAEQRYAEMREECAQLKHREIMLKRAHGALADAGCVVPIELDKTIEHAIHELAERARKATNT